MARNRETTSNLPGIPTGAGSLDALYQAHHVVHEAYQDAISASRRRMVSLESLDGTRVGMEHTSIHPGYVALDKVYLPLDDDPRRADVISRMTGKLAAVHVPRGTTVLDTDEANPASYVLLDPRGANGAVMRTMHQQPHREANVAWLWDGLRRPLGIFRHNPHDGELDLLGTLSDVHAINEMPMFIQPKKENGNEFNLAFGLPKEVIQREREAQLSGKHVEFAMDEKGELLPVPKTEQDFPGGLTAGMLIRGVVATRKVRDMCAEAGITDPTEDILERLSKNEYQAYMRLPNQQYASWVERAVQMYDAFDAHHRSIGKKMDAQSKYQFHELILDTACAGYLDQRFSRQTRENAQMGVRHGMFGRIGMIDVTDESMQKLAKGFAGNAGLDLEDPDARALVNGTIYITNNGLLPGAMELKMLGTDTKKELGRIFMMANSHGSMAPYRGFGEINEVIEELAGGPIEGVPKTPGLQAVLGITNTTNYTGDGMETLLVVDFNEFPGVGMEWYLHGHPHWTYRYEDVRNSDDKVTLNKIIRGNWEQSIRLDSPAARLRKTAAALVALHDDTRDEDGADRGWRLVTTIEKESSFGIVINTNAIAPADPKALELEAPQREVMVAKDTVTYMHPDKPNTPIGRFTKKEHRESAAIQGNLALPEGVKLVVGGIVEADGAIHLRKRTQAHLEREAKEAEVSGIEVTNPLPVPQVIVMSGGRR